MGEPLIMRYECWIVSKDGEVVPVRSTEHGSGWLTVEDFLKAVKGWARSDVRMLPTGYETTEPHHSTGVFERVTLLPVVGAGR